jgi:hypothetical protein
LSVETVPEAPVVVAMSEAAAAEPVLQEADAQAPTAETETAATST